MQPSQVLAKTQQKALLASALAAVFQRHHSRVHKSPSTRTPLPNPFPNPDTSMQPRCLLHMKHGVTMLHAGSGTKTPPS